MDILDDALEVSGPRRDFVTEHLPEIIGAEQVSTDGDFIELGNRLHAGNLMGDGRRLITTIRTDYIGWQVDRFFRATKFALPSVVTVGQALFEKVVDRSEESKEGLGDTGLQKAVIECPLDQGGSSVRFDHSLRYVKKDIAPECLKGVGEAYTVYRVIRGNDLLGLHHPCADKTIMQDTFNVFTPEMAQAERQRLNSRNSAQERTIGKSVVSGPAYTLIARGFRREGRRMRATGATSVWRLRPRDSR